MPNEPLISLSLRAHGDDAPIAAPMPCAVCRRRLRWRGRQVFTNCTCLQLGRGYTVLFCALGVATAVAAASAIYVAGRRGR